MDIMSKSLVNKCTQAKAQLVDDTLGADDRHATSKVATTACHKHSRYEGNELSCSHQKNHHGKDDSFNC